MEELSIKWELKHERPEKIPGCQDTSQLHRLEPGSTDCDGEQCFYYTCKMCIPKLTLEKFNSKYNTELYVIPRISSIKKPDLFTEHHGYHGEMVEFYANYLERLESLTGIAVNGWSNQAARKIFNSVEKTFEQINPKESSKHLALQEIEKKLTTWNKRRKLHKNLEYQTVRTRRRCRSSQIQRTAETTILLERSKSVGSISNATPATKKISRDFEIDWILFNGSTLTVVEVGEEGSREKGSDSKENASEWKRHKIVPEKIEQIKKYQIIMKSFLSAVGAPDVTVKYLLVYPNLLMREVNTELIQSGFFQKMTKWKPLVNYSKFRKYMQLFMTCLEFWDLGIWFYWTIKKVMNSAQFE